MNAIEEISERLRIPVSEEFQTNQRRTSLAAHEI